MLEYYADGKLVTWLRDRSLNNEADDIEKLNKKSKKFYGELCKIFNAEFPSDFDETNRDYDIDRITRRIEKKRILRALTDDEEMIGKVDQIALDQNDLYDIYDDGIKEIYLFQGEFEIPLSGTDVTYIGIEDPILTIRAADNVNFKKKNIRFVNCVYGWDVSDTSKNDDMKYAEGLLFKGEYKYAVDLLKNCAESGNPRAYVLLRHIEAFYYNSVIFKHNKELKNGSEICGIVQAYTYWKNSLNDDEDCFRLLKRLDNLSEKYFQLLKKLADKGDWLCEFYYAELLHRRGNLNRQQTVDEIIGYYKASADKGNFRAIINLFFIYLDYKTSVLKNEKEALIFLTQYAEKGEPLVQMELSLSYSLGLYGTEKNDEKAKEWLIKAAENGLPKAQYYLGEEYLHGSDCVEKNIQKAIEWLTISAKNGELSSYGILGDYYYKNIDYHEAVKWYLKYFEESDEFDDRITFILGNCFYYGKGVEQDYVKAFGLFDLIVSANEGRVNEAAYMLGEAYFYGKGVDENKKKAIEWYVKSANEDACYKLAEIYYYGHGVKADYEQTFKWLSTDDCCWFSEDELRKFKEVFKSIYKAAETGNTDKQYELGFCYYYGIGTTLDYDRAQEWFEKAAENGNAKALYILGEDHLHKNAQKAIEFLERSAQKGYVKAMKELGYRYYYGFGDQKKNYKEALKWYTMAAEHGADVYREIEMIRSKPNKEENS